MVHARKTELRPEEKPGAREGHRQDRAWDQNRETRTGNKDKIGPAGGGLEKGGRDWWNFLTNNNAVSTK